jgi:hypothetical protein
MPLFNRAKRLLWGHAERIRNSKISFTGSLNRRSGVPIATAQFSVVGAPSGTIAFSGVPAWFAAPTFHKSVVL